MEEKIQKLEDEKMEAIANANNELEEKEIEEKFNKKINDAIDELDAEMDKKIAQDDMLLEAEQVWYQIFYESEEALKIVSLVRSMYPWMLDRDILGALMKDHPEFAQKLISWYWEIDVAAEIGNYIKSVKK